MRSLNWKLGGSLFLIVLLSVGLTAFLTNRSTASEFEQYVSAGSTMFARSAAENMVDYYEEYGTWDNLQNSLDRLPVPSYQRVIIADSGGTVVGDSSGMVIGESTGTLGLTGGIPIQVSGTTAGTLYVLTTGTTGRGRMGQGGSTAPLLATAEETFLRNVNDSLWKAGLISAVVALIIGLLLTRQITRPVKALITGVRHIASGELSYRVTVSSRDEIGELADSFNSMATTLEKADHSRRQLTADIAHELRTPLTIIEGTVDGIIDGVFEPDNRHLESIREQTVLLTHLIKDLRDISLAESGQLKPDKVPTEPAELIRRVITGHEPAAKEKGIRLHFEETTALPETEIDPVRIEQVLSNLTVNAIRHTPAGGSVTFTADISGDELAISVTDTGEGIEAEDIPHIFERFYRPGTSRSRREGGTGLGLAIVKQMVEIHGGRVTVESAKGTGSTFRVFLPLSQSQN